MNLDDRLRSAQQAQLDAVGAEVRQRGLDVPQANRGRRRPYALALVAAAAGLVAILQVGPRLATEPIVMDSPASETVEEPTSVPSTSTIANEEATTTSATTLSTDSSTSSPASTSPTTTPTTVTTASDAASGDTTIGDTATEFDAGVANDVCMSGRRAQLELAELRYVTDEQGWNRKGDLVNEQDGPFYFGLWEPDYPGTVSVEVTLETPVQATEIMLAQHPYQDVSGVITIETADTVIPIELAGRDGFQTHSFSAPVAIESFIITRSDAAANITEVILCVIEAADQES